MLLFLLACSTPEAPPAPAPEAPVAAAPAPATAPAAAPADNGAAFDKEAVAGLLVGADFAAATPVSADALCTDAATWNGKEVTVEATVKEVCQKKGCWHTLATNDPAVSVMVKDKEYAIFLPKGSAGKKVHVHGTFAVTEIPEDEAKHYAEDAGKDPSAITGPQKSFQVDVSGVRFL